MPGIGFCHGALAKQVWSPGQAGRKGWHLSMAAAAVPRCDFVFLREASAVP